MGKAYYVDQVPCEFTYLPYNTMPPSTAYTYQVLHVFLTFPCCFFYFLFPSQSRM